mmetsp:Transcript_39068/g.124004  ORF Transcript_39068/g.124004 Transcript_39068/m.124004 type:complete len:111 (+) Transcript_39068:91-423(+)
MLVSRSDRHSREGVRTSRQQAMHQQVFSAISFHTSSVVSGQWSLALPGAIGKIGNDRNSLGFSTPASEILERDPIVYPRRFIRQLCHRAMSGGDLKNSRNMTCRPVTCRC